MGNHSTKHLLLVITAIALSGCGVKNAGSLGGGGSILDEIFSNRPIAPRPQMVTVHLSKPALLAVGKKTPKGWVIADSDKQAGVERTNGVDRGGSEARSDRSRAFPISSRAECRDIHWRRQSHMIF